MMNYVLTVKFPDLIINRVNEFVTKLKMKPTFY